jgi:hypothetical protein
VAKKFIKLALISKRGTALLIYLTGTGSIHTRGFSGKSQSSKHYLGVAT